MTQQTKQKPKTQQDPKTQASPEVFDAEIVLYQQELVEITTKMEKTSQQFIAATIASLNRWYAATARSYVQDQYELTNRLGIEKVRDLKRYVAQLVAAVPKDAQRLLCDGNLWWHKSRGGGWQDHYAQGPPDGLSMAIWALAERIRPVLEAFGYIKREPTPEPKDQEENTKSRRPATKPKKHALPEIEWTEEMKKSIESYKEDLGRATFLDGKMQQAKKRKARHKAGILWDQA
jgi:hypothetical protein